MKGRVQSWSDSRGFGFIVDEKKRVYFIHYTQIGGDGFKTLNIDQEVEFNVYQTDSGLEAKDLVKL